MQPMIIEEVRSFNRFYTVFMGILNRHYLNSRFSLPETRVMHAVYTTPGITPGAIILQLNIDKSYLSRMIAHLEKKKLLVKKPSATDGRSINLYLTASGKKAFEQLDTAATRETGILLQHLDEQKGMELVGYMQRIQQLLQQDEQASTWPTGKL